MAQPRVQSKNAVDTKVLVKNIGYNLDKIENWLTPIYSHSRKALIVSAGSSLERHLPEIKRYKEELHYDVYCVKHSLRKLIKAGIEPTGVFILDPRYNDAPSTAGEIRKSLYDGIPADIKTKFFVASMTNTRVTDLLLEKGFDVIGWHATVNGLEHFKDEVKMSIPMGTCSAMRGVGLLRAMGYSNIEVVAVDSDVPEPTEEEKNERTVEGPAKFIKYDVFNREEGSLKTYWTTGEFIAQLQDIEYIFKQLYYDANLTMWEGGLGYQVYKQAMATKDPKKNIEDTVLTS